MAEMAMPLGQSEERASKAGSASKSAETNAGGKEPIKWVTVEKTMGYIPAKMMADRLMTDGIPARAWQEGAGQALGLTVGILGNGHVDVPQEYEAQARQILEEIANEPIEWEIDEEPTTDDS